MTAASALEIYEPVIVPALQRIQEAYGYLNRGELERYSNESKIPLYKLHTVASFFPHFQLTPPKKCTVKVCRDMACHLAGSADTLRELQSIVGKDVAVEGVSCVGRCDRAAAASVTLLADAAHGAHGAHATPAAHDQELYYLGRSAAELKQIVTACVAGSPPPSDHDAALPYAAKHWVIDSYQGGTPTYEGVKKAVALRDASLQKAAEILRAKYQWGPDRLERFREAAIRQMRVDFKLDAEVTQAVRNWQTEKDWAKPPEKVKAPRGKTPAPASPEPAPAAKPPGFEVWSAALLAEFEAGALRGLGGAGIPAATKWEDVRAAVRTARERGEDDRAFIVVNGDESEPGTFKDRELLLRAPHTILEGVILAGLITEATQGFIYIRHEYHEQIEACRAEIARAEELGVCGLDAHLLGRPFPVSVFVSPGGYICGEQSALIEAMSDRRGEPRNMPPKLETNGLQDLPTLVSNVETFAWAPYICRNGGATYAALGENTWKGRRFFSISGDVKRPGVYEVPMGMKLRDLVYGAEYAQGMVGDRPLKAFAPSGPSGGFLPAKLTAEAGLPREYTESKAWQAFATRHQLDPKATELDILELELELDLFRALSPTGALGAGVVVYAEGRDMAVETLNSLEFFRVESCGKCVPCRLGSQKLASLLGHLLAKNISAPRWKDELAPVIGEMREAIQQASICGLGRSVPVPLGTAINYFPNDIQQYLTAAPKAATPPVATARAAAHP